MSGNQINGRSSTLTNCQWPWTNRWGYRDNAARNPLFSASSVGNWAAGNYFIWKQQVNTGKIVCANVLNSTENNWSLNTINKFCTNDKKKFNTVIWKNYATNMFYLSSVSILWAKISLLFMFFQHCNRNSKNALYVNNIKSLVLDN